ncbi:uncharacterized protein IL334_005549 [Kwoniella shivajii]|uniref:Mitochondrial K+-H+ exchange-related-domain-containing protein n=1 Tax=Kwoniella shivajii TaxID=564305 RepID=A0ABZ1D6J6_9TREE|nr:hypothetical protein IL334_005549 [Kwoniella shivajii]
MTSKIPKTVASIPQRQFRIFALPLARIPKPFSEPLSPPPIVQPTPTSDSASTSASASASVSASASASISASKGNDDHDVSQSSSSSTSSSTSAKTPLMLFHTSQPDPLPESGPPNILNRGLNKASETWLNLGKKPKDSWTFWFYAKGEKLMDRIEYEEWSLKVIKENEGVKIDKDGKIQGEKIEIPLLRPSIKGTTLPPLLPKLHRLLIHRIPYHKKMMYRSLFFTPFTAPFAIIPVIPNFPFFYVLWRAWSHYKAWRGALYLETLLKHGLIVEKESEELTKVYSSKSSTSTLSVTDGKSGPNENHAPDETTSGNANLKDLATGSTSSSTPSTSATRTSGELPKQAKGETSTSIDGTSTPSSLIHKPSTSTSSSSSSSSASSESATTKDEEDLTSEEKKTEQPYPSPAPGPITSKAQHPSLLLSPSQIPLLAKTFNLRPYEVMDITRAVEQADYRARKSDKAKADKEASDRQEKDKKEEQEKGKSDGSDKGEKSTEWKGNLHR